MVRYVLLFFLLKLLILTNIDHKQMGINVGIQGSLFVIAGTQYQKWINIYIILVHLLFLLGLEYCSVLTETGYLTVLLPMILIPLIQLLLFTSQSSWLIGKRLLSYVKTCIVIYHLYLWIFSIPDALHYQEQSLIEQHKAAQLSGSNEYMGGS